MKPLQLITIHYQVMWEVIVSTTRSGHYAEEQAAKYLAEHNYKVLARNWKRPSAEIDIVAQKDTVVYFVEVKYRSTDHYGGGLDYIVSQKLGHMRRAAQLWVAEHGWQGQFQLAAIEVSGPNFAVSNFIESIY